MCKKWIFYVTMLVVLSGVVGCGGSSSNDADKPVLTNVESTEPTSIILTFSEPMSDKSADPSNFSVYHCSIEQDPCPAENRVALLVTDASLNEHKTQVQLTTLPQEVGIEYTVEVKNAEDLNGNIISTTTNTVTADDSVSNTLEPPRVIGAISTSNTSVLISFSKPMSVSVENVQNYEVVQENINSEAGTLNIVSARYVEETQRTAVELITLSQNELTYRVTVVNVKDTFNQSLDTQFTNGGLFGSNSTTFAGTPPAGDSIVDSDGDGLPDNIEQSGWLVGVVNGNGQVVIREVTSDPTIPDTDGDGLSDAVERSLNTNPRARDTDGDLLGDAHEYNGIFSSPTEQDSDRDGLMDGEEVIFYKTSPLLNDTDGDQILDDEEVVLANRNARIADLAEPTIEIESISLELDVRFDQTNDSKTTMLEESTFSTTLTQSNSKAYAKTNEEDNRVAASVTASHAFEIGADTLFVPKGKIAVSVTARAEHAWSSSWSSESSKTAQNEYNESLSATEEISEGTTVSRHIDAARVSTLVYLAAEGDVAFTIRDLQITALVADVRNPGKYLPVATLIPDYHDDNLNNEFHLGPLADKIGPLIFTNKDIFPAQVERLMRDPSGVIFKISNYNITDENERSFAYSSQDVVDRTTSLSFDFGGIDGAEFYRVATSFGRPIGSIADIIAQQQQPPMTPAEVRAEYGLADDDDTSLISYDLSGKNIGVVFHAVMQDVLGMKHYDDASDTADPSEQFASYATTFNDFGVERVTRIRQTKNALNRQWSLLTPTGLITDAQLSFGAGAIKADDQIMLPGSGISMAYITDVDGDRIPARLEYLHGCSDNEVDSDGDGLSDILEVFGAAKNSDGAYLNPEDKWEVNVKGIGNYEGFSSCSSKDTDADGISDFVEYGYEKDLDPTDLSADEASEILRKIDPNTGVATATDAKSQDTDGDGISDFKEINGYIVQLGFPRVTTGDKPSKCTDLIDDTTSVNGVLLDKVTCTSDPLNFDSDGDALPDGDEFAFFADPTRKDAGDVSDVDGDNLLGREEIDGWPVTFTYAGLINLYTSIDPPVIVSTEDTGDSIVEFNCEPGIAGCYSPIFSGYYGIANYEGVFLTSNPVVKDTDGDGLRDDIENDISLANTGYIGSTHPRMLDTDQDGRPDFEELMGYPFKDANIDLSKPYQGSIEVPVKTDPLNHDTDGDLRTDGDEVNNSWKVSVVGIVDTLTVYSDPNEKDRDDDELNDSEEEQHKTDPNNPNTDGTADILALKDGHEIKLGLNPLNPNDMCVQITFTSFKILHDFVNIDEGDIRGDISVQRYSNGANGEFYIEDAHIETYNTVDDGVVESVSGLQYTTYALMSDELSIKVSTGNFQFRPVAGSWWDIFNGNKVITTADFTLADKEHEYSYEKNFNGVGGSFSPYFNFKAMTGTDVDNNPGETFCQGQGL